ncbi:Abi family protein [Paenibacillus alvei]|nr:Abi family protein [Paenibacillus alvei]
MDASVIELKPPTTYEEQLDLLRSRGLIIPNEVNAITVLKRINYYRFTAYTLTFKENDKFFSNVTFDTIYRHYEFDARIRQHVMKIVEYVEIAFRTHIAYTIAHNYGSEGHKSTSMYHNSDWCIELNSELERCISKSKDPFVLHHLSKYSGKFPIWVAVEVLTFSWFSKLYKNLRIKDKKKISKFYNVHFDEISNWLHTLTIVRNRCAHYSRLFNQKLPVNVKFREKDKRFEIRDNQLYAIIFNMQYLIKEDQTWNSWVAELESIIEKYDEVNIRLLGFPEQWKSYLYARLGCSMNK